MFMKIDSHANKKVSISIKTVAPVSLAEPSGSKAAQLHSKLQAAAQRINQLSQEKEQLIQIGNRLRAELAAYSGKFQSFSLTQIY